MYTYINDMGPPGPRVAKFVYNYNFTMVYGRQITTVRGDYKPTYNVWDPGTVRPLAISGTSGRKNCDPKRSLDTLASLVGYEEYRNHRTFNRKTTGK